MQKQKVYKTYSDDGHGWLAVKIQELMELNIWHKISSYSYIRGKTAYIEEDCDMTEFINAYRDKYGCDPTMKHVRVNGRSPIRSYESYNHNKAINILLTGKMLKGTK